MPRSSPPRPQQYPLLDAVLTGETGDVYFPRTMHVLASLGRDPSVSMVIFSSRGGSLAGVSQAVELLRQVGFAGTIYALDDGDSFAPGEAVLVISGKYRSFGIYETAVLGILSSSTGWATAARECVEAADPVPVVSFGARHIHPNVAAIMDAVAVRAGCSSCSTPLGALLSGVEVSGTMPHALVLIAGDTVTAAEAFDAVIPDGVPRTILVDTFTDEAVESLRVAEALGGRLQGVRLDTPAERGGVTVSLVKEVRARLDAAGFDWVRVFVSGGVNPLRILAFREGHAPVDGYGIGSYIAGAAPIEFTADIREIDGSPISKRGRVPGLPDMTRLDSK